MRTEDCNIVSLGKRKRELQNELQEKPLRRKPASSLDKSDPDDLECVNLDHTAQGVDEERLRELMTELMEEIGMTQPAAHLPNGYDHRQCSATACDVAVTPTGFSCNSASASTSSMLTCTLPFSPEYSRGQVLAETDIQFSGNVVPAVVCNDPLHGVRALVVRDEAPVSALGCPDDRGVSTSDQN